MLTSVFFLFWFPCSVSSDSQATCSLVCYMFVSVIEKKPMFSRTGLITSVNCIFGLPLFLLDHSFVLHNIYTSEINTKFPFWFVLMCAFKAVLAYAFIQFTHNLIFSSKKYIVSYCFHNVTNIEHIYYRYTIILLFSQLSHMLNIAIIKRHSLLYKDKKR